MLYAAGTLSAGPPRPSPAAWPSATPRVGHGEDTSLEDALCWLIWRIERSSQELPGVVQEGEDGESAWGGDEVAVVPFPQAPHRTRRAPFDATGSRRSLSFRVSVEGGEPGPGRFPCSLRFAREGGARLLSGMIAGRGRSCSISSLPSWVCWPSPVRVRRGRPAAGSPLRSSRPACCWPSVCPKGSSRPVDRLSGLSECRVGWRLALGRRPQFLGSGRPLHVRHGPGGRPGGAGTPAHHAATVVALGGVGSSACGRGRAGRAHRPGEFVGRPQSLRAGRRSLVCPGARPRRASAGDRGRPTGPAARLLSGRLVVLVGLCSYSVFLWHEPLVRLLRSQGLTFPGRTGWLLNLVIVVALTAAVSAATYKWVGRPALRRTRRSSAPERRSASDSAFTPGLSACWTGTLPARASTECGARATARVSGDPELALYTVISYSPGRLQ